MPPLTAHAGVPKCDVAGNAFQPLVSTRLCQVSVVAWTPGLAWMSGLAWLPAEPASTVTEMMAVAITAARGRMRRIASPSRVSAREYHGHVSRIVASGGSAAYPSFDVTFGGKVSGASTHLYVLHGPPIWLVRDEPSDGDCTRDSLDQVNSERAGGNVGDGRAHRGARHVVLRCDEHDAAAGQGHAGLGGRGLPRGDGQLPA